MPARPRRIVIFDFDGTLSTSDANNAFWHYCFRHSVRPWLFLPIVAVGFVVMFIARGLLKLRMVTNISPIAILWREMIRLFYTPALVARLAPGFIAAFKLNRFGWAADQVAKERAAGSLVILSSAGMEYLIKPLVSDMDFDFIITSNTASAHPWKILFFNYGANKIETLNALLNLEFGADLQTDGGFRIVRSYSDNRSDAPVMSCAREEVWIDPKTGAVRKVVKSIQ